MRRLRHSRPSPALIVAVVALVGALGGSAVAEQATTSVTKKKTKKIAKKQANKAIDAVLPVDSTELGSIETRSQSQTVTNNYVELTADCETGEKVLSGGFETNNVNLNEFDFFPFESFKDNEGWYVRGFVSGTKTLTVHAYCLQNAA
jgi:hypothetical protein